ncbi:sigma-70 family RNA polymerase sigma factor [Clostridium sp. MSJ-11]|uniref:Sigma-70 family RNA polymerase sigma factor n=1 Tax=Clostridium mobile TaxID=2841512 RepID=A0ABS6EML8_9CLOT|nr:sigma-70 family RNA polymerase sigma factor [Clostridium mobile]MBU5486260.1 sigma-70 family RNA polymerase sigma factor [Clostridium mobile]
MKTTKQNLIKKIKRKNPQAMDFLVDKYGRLLYKVIYKVLSVFNDEGIIDECMNDVLLNIWANIDKYSGEDNIELEGEEVRFKNWICVIARYKSIDYYRKLINEKEKVHIEQCSIISDFSIEEDIILKEEKEELYDYINNMNDIDKKIFIMRYYLEQSVEDIAKDLNLSISSVYTRLSRGRNHLRDRYKNSKEVYMDEGYIRAF